MNENKQKIINDLRRNVYCRLQPSPLHGIGIFAIKDIPKGTNPFQWFPGHVTAEDEILIPREEIEDDPKIPTEVKRYVKDFIPLENGCYAYPTMSMNELDIAFYVNHSETPNLSSPDDGVTLIANRDITAGEELCTDYSTYSHEKPGWWNAPNEKKE